MEQPTKEKSVLPLTTGTYYLPLRQDFIAICEACEKDDEKSPRASAYCMALILAVMEKWTNEKKKAQVNLYVTMTYAQWESEIYGAFKRNTIIDSLQVLVSNGLLYREAFKRASGGKDQFKYLLSIEIIKNKLAATFQNQLCQSPILNDQHPKRDFATSQKGLCEVSNSSVATSQKGRFKEETSHYTESNKEEESASLSSPAFLVWNTWCEAQGYGLKRSWTKTERERCIALAEMDIDLTPQLMSQVRDWAQDKQPFLRNNWALKNLINALPDYFKQATPEASQQQPEMPELTEEELDENVLWTSSPSAAKRLFADGATMKDHLADRYCKPRWMPRRDAREYDYDMPGVQHYTLAQQAEYEQLTGQRDLAIAG